jgi:hypothetical protein
MPAFISDGSLARQSICIGAEAIAAEDDASSGRVQTTLG